MKTKYFKLKDEELIKLFREDKKIAEEAFNIFYRRYHIRVYSYFLRKLNNRFDAEDTHQDTFEKFFKCVIDGQEIQSAEAFLFRIAKNIYLNHEIKKYYKNSIDHSEHFKGLKKEISIEEVNCIEEILVENLSYYIEAKELLNLIKIAIDKLENKYKDPFVDRKLMDISITEIAQKYNLSYEGAKKRVDRAMMKIKEMLKPYIDDISTSNN